MTDAALLPFDPSTLGTECALGDVAKSLRALWTQSAAGTKASLINFAVYSEDAAQLAENSALLAEVTREHACRALLLGVEPAALTSPVRAWTTAHCQLTSGGTKAVCSEQVSFYLPGPNPETVCNILLANLESDLPLILWWQAQITERFEPHVYRRCDRLIVDSATWTHPQEAISRLRTAWRDTHAHCVVLDLVYMRLFAFRLALAGTFDEAPVRALLEDHTTLEIIHAPGHRTTAWLLAAWIAHKAGWTIQSATTATRLNGGPPLQLTVCRGPESLPLATLSLQGPHGGVTISRKPGVAFLQATWQAGEARGEHIVPMVAESTAELIAQRLSRGGNNPLYFKLWSMIEKVL
jgi:glucose-6-phosphate dehydrogenase assembly protein OpcA